MAHPALFEPLEKRQLLTAIVNGLFTGTNSVYDGQNFFEYLQADGTPVRISVQGNLTAEFIGARLPEGSFTPIIRDLVPATQTDSEGVDLFSIYVVSSDVNTIISIATVPAVTADDRPMDPFGSSAGSISAPNATDGEIEQFTLGTTGGVYIGARVSSSIADINDTPIITTTRRAFGLRPASAGQMFSGLEVAPGNDLGRFLLGGTITGLVDISGSCQFFYAGNILTGNTRGLGASSTTTVPNNFYVGGDLENLVVSGSIGTITLVRETPLADIEYKSGFQMRVRGRVGQIHTLDSFLGAATIENNRAVAGTGLAQLEVELRGRTFPSVGNTTYFDPVFGPGGANLGGRGPFGGVFNDNFDSAQALGTLTSTELNQRDVIQLRGSLNGDPLVNDRVDYYSVSLLGGQSIELQILGNLSSNIGVFDPDGRLIATDYTNLFSVPVADNRLNKPFRITADRPGSYRIAVAYRNDINFNGADDDRSPHVRLNPDNYELRVRLAGNLALGGLRVANHIATYDVGSTGIDILRGDVGTIRAGTLGLGTIFSFSNPWNVSDGNFREMESVSMGILEGALYRGGGPDFFVPRGSVGMLRATGLDPTENILIVNDDLASSLQDLTRLNPALAVGGDIQLVDATNTNLEGVLLANRSIGIIRAEEISTFNGPPVWVVNVDRTGDDGRIDLIDVFSPDATRGNIGDLADGGPAIATGPGGNVRYMRSSGQVFRDRFFGGGLPERTIFDPGAIARLTDDNGTAVNIEPIPVLRPIDPVTGLPTFGVDRPGFLTITTYGIRDKAGVVITNVTVNNNTASILSPGRGVEITSGARGRGGSVEIGEVFVRSQGTDYIFDEVARTFAPENTVGVAEGQPSDLNLRGASPVDVWSIVARDPANTAFTGLTQISNSTAGEIVNVVARHIGSIGANTIGLAKQSTGAAVMGSQILTNAFPFQQQRNLVFVTGDAGGSHIVSVRARRAVGNLLANGSIGSVIANSDGKNEKGVHDGVAAPIYAANAASPDFGNIVSVNVGEGLDFSGTGDVAFSGIYADNIIDSVRAVNADIRGDIVAAGRSPASITAAGSSPNFFIGAVNVTNGSIIEADILTVTNLADSREAIGPIVIPQRSDTINNPVFDIGAIRVTGTGGIIGTKIAAEDVGPITVSGGFGFLNNSIDSLGDSVISGITADGYGIRRSRIEGGANINRIVATGNGKRLDTTYYSASVRQSESKTIDGYTGLTIDDTNDLHKFLGTTRTAPKRKGISDSGLIEDSIFTGSRQLSFMQAHRIIGRNVLVSDPFTGQRSRIDYGDSTYPMRISFGNRVREIRTGDIIDGLSMQTGGLDLLNSGGDVQNTEMRVAGRIQQLRTNGAFRGTMTVLAEGPEGQIDVINTKRSLFATINASVDIGTIRVGTDLGSPNIRAGRHLTTLQVNGNTLSGASVFVNNTLTNLLIGGDHGTGATITADEIVNQAIGGQVFGDIVIT